MATEDKGEDVGVYRLAGTVSRHTWRDAGEGRLVVWSQDELHTFEDWREVRFDDAAITAGPSGAPRLVDAGSIDTGSAGSSDAPPLADVATLDETGRVEIAPAQIGIHDARSLREAVASAWAADGTVEIENERLVYTAGPDYRDGDALRLALRDNGRDGGREGMAGGGGGETPLVVPVTGERRHVVELETSLVHIDEVGGTVDQDLGRLLFDTEHGQSLVFSAEGLPAGLAIDPLTGHVSGTLEPGVTVGEPHLVTVEGESGAGRVLRTSFEWTVREPVASEGEGLALGAAPDGVDDAPARAAILEATADEGVPGEEESGGEGTDVAARSDDAPDAQAKAERNAGAEAVTPAFADLGALLGVPLEARAARLSPTDDARKRRAEEAEVEPDDAARPRGRGEAADEEAAPAPAQTARAPRRATGEDEADANGGQGAASRSAAARAALREEESETAPLAMSDDDGEGEGASASAAFPGAPFGGVEPDAPNGAPQPATLDVIAATEDGSVSGIDVLSGARDADGDALSVLEATARNGAVSVNPDGTLDYAPDADFEGTDTITYTLGDGTDTATGRVDVRVAGVNDAPLPGTPSPGAMFEDGLLTLDVLRAASDPDGDALTVAAATAGNGTVFIRPDGLLDYAPAADFNGTDTITYTLSDGRGATATGTLAVTVAAVNDAPDAGAPPPVTVAEDAAPTRIDVLAAASDRDGDALSIASATAGNGTVAVEADGTLLYTPRADFNGADTITYLLDDGRGGTATGTVAVTVAPVNDAPDAGGPAPATVAEDGGVTLDVLAAASDRDGDALAVTSASAANGTVSVNPDGTLLYAPNGDFNGTDTVTYTLDDGRGGTATGTVAITVTPVNDAPDAGAPPPVTVAEDGSATFEVLSAASDVDGDTLAVTDASAANGSVTVNPDGTLLYRPDADFHGTDTITYGITDGRGGTATGTLAVTVTPVNDAPEAGSPPPVTVAEDGVLRGVDVLSAATDRDGDAPTVTGASAANGAVTVNPDGTLDYAPAANFNGTDTITYTLDDGRGGTATGTLAVTVTPVNDAPEAGSPPPVTVAEDGAATFDVLSAASDPDGDALALTGASALNGSVTVNPDGTLRYAPDADFHGADTITYTLDDGRGGTATGTLAVSVTPVGDPVTGIDVTVPGPVAEDAGAGTVVATLAAIDADGSDADGGDTHAFAIVDATDTPVAHPLFEIVGDELRLRAGATLDAETAATLTVLVRATDGQGHGFTTSVTVDVADVAEHLQLADAGGVFADLDVTELSVTAGAGGWTITGTTGDDTIIGGADEDLFVDTAGADSYTAGSAADTLSYADATGGVAVLLADTGAGGIHGAMANTGAGGHGFEAEGDRYNGIREVTTTGFDDLVFADAAGTRAVLGAGDDAFDVDPLSLGDDSVYGDAGNDVIRTGGGGDLVFGGADDDVIEGGAGADALYGGAGTDTAVFSGPRAAYAFSQNPDGSVMASGPDGTDTLREIEFARFDDGTFALADLFGQTITGTTGDDVLVGGASDDTFVALAGDDVIVAGGGADAIDGGAGLDTVDYSAATGGVVVLLETTAGSGAGGRYVNTAEGGYGFEAEGDSYNNIERVVGSDFDDVVYGSHTAGTTAHLNAGDDVFDNEDVYAVDDWVEGGAGNDVVITGAGDDRLGGGAGDDRLEGETGDDVLDGGAGADILDGGAGFDTADYSAATGGVRIFLQDVDAAGLDGAHAGALAGGHGAEAQGDTLVGIERVVASGFDDHVYGAEAGTVVELGAGDDVFDTSATALGHTVFGGAGNDRMVFGAGDDVAEGGAGDDVFEGQGGTDVFDGGDGTDTARHSGPRSAYTVTDNGDGTIEVTNGTSRETLRDVEFLQFSDGTFAVGDLLGGTFTGDNNANTLNGTRWNDVIEGLDGDDTINGGAGDDIVYGNKDKDNIFGGDGDDTLYGGDNEDTIEGGAGDDTIDGGLKDDVLSGGAGADVMQGGFGNDRLSGDEGDDRLSGDDGQDILRGGDGNDTLRGGLQDDELHGGIGRDVLMGEDGNDLLDGGDGDDQLDGGAGDDELFGGAGADTLEGGDKKDRLDGGLGDDVLRGGADDDILTAGFGDDVLDGGAGNDDVLFSGLQADYDVHRNPDGTYTVTDLRAGSPDGTDTLIGIERLRFADGDRDVADAVTTVSPVAFDLDGSGRIETTGATTARERDGTDVGETVMFDIDADGALDAIEWMAGTGDALLVDDRDGRAAADMDGARLFGDEGGTYAHGYEKLALLDADGDGALAGAELSGLKLWRDDGDASVDDGELVPLSDFGIVRVEVMPHVVQDGEGRDLIRAQAETADGRTVMSEDVWFARRADEPDQVLQPDEAA